jgi:hypothetical protein
MSRDGRRVRDTATARARAAAARARAGDVYEPHMEFHYDY